VSEETDFGKRVSVKESPLHTNEKGPDIETLDEAEVTGDIVNQTNVSTATSQQLAILGAKMGAKVVFDILDHVDQKPDMTKQDVINHFRATAAALWNQR
jgi:hypothetical protein